MPKAPKGETRPANVLGKAAHVIRIATRINLLQTIVVVIFLSSLNDAHSQSNQISTAAPAEREGLRLCWNHFAQSYAIKTCEPAESVIMAVFGKCMNVQEQYRESLISAAQLSESGAREFIDGYRAGGREHMASVILDARSMSGSCQNSK